MKMYPSEGTTRYEVECASCSEMKRGVKIWEGHFVNDGSVRFARYDPEQKEKIGEISPLMTKWVCVTIKNYKLHCIETYKEGRVDGKEETY